MLAYGGNDWIDAAAGDDLLDGGSGNDTLLGGAGNGILDGAWGDDWLDGGQDSDTYLASGRKVDTWNSFQGFDTYADSGTTGTDRLVAEGNGPVDQGLKSFPVASGIEQFVNATTSLEPAAGPAQVTLLGDSTGSVLDFSGVSLIGGNFVLDGGVGHDTLVGTGLADRLRGGVGLDTLQGGAGADMFDYTNLKEALWSGDSRI